MGNKSSELNLILIKMLFAYVTLFLLLFVWHEIHSILVRFDGSNIRQHWPASGANYDSVATPNLIHNVCHSRWPNDNPYKDNNADENGHNGDDVNLENMKSSGIHFV